MTDSPDQPARRRLILGAAATLGTAAALPARAQTASAVAAMEKTSTEFEAPAQQGTIRYNISAFMMKDWRDYFQNTRNGVILVDTVSRCLHYWSEDLATYRLYPTSVPMSNELTKRGRTGIVRKAKNPPWRATAEELKLYPDWPKFVAGGAPDNPLGVRSLYLGWPAYEIHGTHDTRKIGRRSSNGCIGLYNEHILELYGYAKIGTQVVLI